MARESPPTSPSPPPTPTPTNANKLLLVKSLSDKPNWENYDDEDEIFVRQLPKVELHVHLDGSFDPDFLYKYMEENPDSVGCLPIKAPLPWEPGKELNVRQLVENCQSAREYHKLCTCRGHRSLNAMLTCFQVFLPLVRRNFNLLEQLAYDFCQRQWEQNIVYTEVRYSPHLFAEGFDETDGDGEAAFLAVTEGLRRGCKQFGVIVNQILCCICWRPEWAMPTLELALKYQNDYPCATVGVDIAAGENHFDSTEHPDLHGPHYEMIQQAKVKKMPITLHAGEEVTGNALENIRKTISDYGAQRIGHGYRMVNCEDVMEQVKKAGAHVEVCPTSSDETGGWIYEKKDWKDHPCLAMRKHGISLSLSSDDPAVFNTSLAWQHRIALTKMKMTRKDLLEINLQAIDAAFCSPEQQRQIKDLIEYFGTLQGFDVPGPCDELLAKGNLRQSVMENFTDRVQLT